MNSCQTDLVNHYKIINVNNPCSKCHHTYISYDNFICLFKCGHWVCIDCMDQHNRCCHICANGDMEMIGNGYQQIYLSCITTQCVFVNLEKTTVRQLKTLFIKMNDIGNKTPDNFYIIYNKQYFRDCETLDKYIMGSGTFLNINCRLSSFVI